MKRNSFKSFQNVLQTIHSTVAKGGAAIRPGGEYFLEKQVDLGLLPERINEAKNKKILNLEEKSQGERKKIIKSKGC